MMNSKPGNQPDPDDMAASLDVEGDANKSADGKPNLEQEEEAERLGDFA